MTRWPVLLIALFSVSALAQPATQGVPLQTLAADIPPSAAQIVAVPPDLQALLRQRVISAGPDREARLQHLIEMLFARDGMDLQYDATATLTVSETWQQRRANCLSFTLLFVALARSAGIQARVQEVDQVVSWYQEDGGLYNVGHVNAGIEVNGRSGTVDLDRNVLYDRKGPRVIDDARAIAHFYNNRGAVQLEAGNGDAARAWFDAALRQSAGFSAALNNLAVLEGRQGNLSLARAYYMDALRSSPRHIPSLINASSLLARMGDRAGAARLQQRLQHVRQRDPFTQYLLGTQAERAGDSDRAIHFYRRALRLYDSAHPFHFALARAYVMAGDLKRAGHELQRAQQLAGAAQQSRYQSKLDSLQR